MSEPIVSSDRSVRIAFITLDGELARSMSGPYTATGEAFSNDDGSWLVEVTFRPQVESGDEPMEPPLSEARAAAKGKLGLA